MEPSVLTINVKIQIQKPVTEVYQAIIDPSKMANYFIAKGSDIMEQGKRLTWKFPEFDTEVPVLVGRLETDQYISFYWDEDDQYLVEFQLSPAKDQTSTLLAIAEKNVKNDTVDIDWLKRNTEGWANFAACLKAYLEYGINLRKGAFDFMKT